MEGPTPYGNVKQGLYWDYHKLYYWDMLLCHFWWQSSLLKGKRILITMNFPASKEFDQVKSVKGTSDLKKIMEKEALLFIAKMKEYELR